MNGAWEKTDPSLDYVELILEESAWVFSQGMRGQGEDRTERQAEGEEVGKGVEEDTPGWLAQCRGG